MALIAKGSRVRFKLEDGRWVSAPRGSAMMHDPSGGDWPKCSCLFVPFKREGREPTKEESDARWWFGRQGRIAVGGTTLPPKTIGKWQEVGPVVRIEYQRGGWRAPGRYFHPFGERTFRMLWKKGTLPILYRRPGAMRLDLGSGCVFDDRGIVYP